MRTDTVIISSSSQRVCKEVQGFVRNTRSGDKICLAASNNEFKNMVLRYRPRLALLESNCWYEATPYMIAQYADRFPHMSIAVFSYERLTPGRAAAFISLGAESYIDLRMDNEDEITEAFNLIMRDGQYLPRWMEAAVAGYELESAGYCRLSKGEIRVLRLLAMGNDIEDVALKLGIEGGTVRNHISNIHKKFSIHSHTELVGLSLRIGIVRPGELVTEAINVKVLEWETQVTMRNEEGGIDYGN
jgi:DNA-binding NarL/FixJ family response regulator